MRGEWLSALEPDEGGWGARQDSRRGVERAWHASFAGFVLEGACVHLLVEGIAQGIDAHARRDVDGEELAVGPLQLTAQGLQRRDDGLLRLAAELVAKADAQGLVAAALDHSADFGLELFAVRRGQHHVPEIQVVGAEGHVLQPVAVVAERLRPERLALEPPVVGQFDADFDEVGGGEGVHLWIRGERYENAHGASSCEAMCWPGSGAIHHLQTMESAVDTELKKRNLPANVHAGLKRAAVLAPVLASLCVILVQPVGAQAGPRDPALAGPILAQLPAPSQSPGPWDRPCVNTMQEQLALRKLTFTSPALQSRYVSEPQIPYALYLWGVKWLGMPEAEDKTLCRDMPHVLRSLQQAAGDAPTGVFGERDLQRIEIALKQANAVLAKAVQDSEKHLPNVFGIFLGAPLRMTPCQTMNDPGPRPPKFVAATCQLTLGRSDEPQPKASVFFSQDEQPSWLGTIGEATSFGLPNPSVQVELHDRKVTAIRFSPRYQANSIALDAMTAKFGVRPEVAKPAEQVCANFFSGDVFRCDGNITSYQWRAKDLIATGYCNSQVFVCEYKIQLISEANRSRASRQKQDTEDRERALRSGRAL